MAIITQAQALLLVPLATMKAELRIPPDILEHDGLLAGQITDATNFVATSTGVALADLPALRPAITSACRELYDGYRELSPIASTYGWMAPFRSYKTTG